MFYLLFFYLFLLFLFSGNISICLNYVEIRKSFRQRTSCFFFNQWCYKVPKDFWCHVFVTCDIDSTIFTYVIPHCWPPFYASFRSKFPVSSDSSWLDWIYFVMVPSTFNGLIFTFFLVVVIRTFLNFLIFTYDPCWNKIV